MSLISSLLSLRYFLAAGAITVSDFFLTGCWHHGMQVLKSGTLATPPGREMMNSSRPNSVEQPFGDWLSKAKRKFVGATIHNSCQFAVAVMNHKDVYLFDDFFDADEVAAKDSNYRLYGLSDEPIQKVNLIAGNIKSSSPSRIGKIASRRSAEHVRMVQGRVRDRPRG